MNRYLLMATAAALGTTSVATPYALAANKPSFDPTTYAKILTNNGVPCQYWGLKTTTTSNGRTYVLYVEYTGPCPGENAYGMAFPQKTKGIPGKIVDFSNNYAPYFEKENTAINYVLSYPFRLKKTGTWSEWMSYSGVTSFEALSGTYTVSKAKPFMKQRSVLHDTLKQALLEGDTAKQ